MKTNKNIKLDEIKKETPFKVPENYFEDFAKKMEEYTCTYAPARKVSLLVKLKPYLYMAASFLLILTVTLTVLNTGKTDEKLLGKEKTDANKNIVASAIDKDSSVIPIDNKQALVSATDDEIYSDDFDDEGAIDEVFGDYEDEI